MQDLGESAEAGEVSDGAEREREGERLAFLAKCGNLVLSYQVFTRSGAFEPTRKGNSPSKEAHSAVKTEPIHSK